MSEAGKKESQRRHGHSLTYEFLNADTLHELRHEKTALDWPGCIPCHEKIFEHGGEPIELGAVRRGRTIQLRGSDRAITGAHREIEVRDDTVEHENCGTQAVAMFDDPPAWFTRQFLHQLKSNDVLSSAVLH